PECLLLVSLPALVLGTIAINQSENVKLSNDWCKATPTWAFRLCPEEDAHNAGIVQSFLGDLEMATSEKLIREGTEKYLRKVFGASYNETETEFVKKATLVNVSWSEAAKTGNKSKWPFDMLDSLSNAVSPAIPLIMSTSKVWRPILIEFAKKYSISIYVEIPSSVQAKAAEFRSFNWSSSVLEDLTTNLSRTIRLITTCAKPEDRTPAQHLMAAFHNRALLNETETDKKCKWKIPEEEKEVK
ncbi:hypothetical protein PMAYCL1PPCAC_15791, partial [Pristionchus mayeri]